MTVKIVPRIERGCGFRVKGGFYVEGSGLSIPCPALDLAIPDCLSCGQPLIPFSRGIKQINPMKQIGEIVDRLGKRNIPCPYREMCDKAVCDPKQERGWVMWVGSEYTMEQFRLEAARMGVSKRVSKFPKELERGDVIYLAYKTAIERKEEKRIVYDPAIFYVFHVTAKVQIVDEEDAKNEAKIKAIEERGITPVMEVNPSLPASQRTTTAAQEG